MATVKSSQVTSGRVHFTDGLKHAHGHKTDTHPYNACQHAMPLCLSQATMRVVVPVVFVVMTFGHKERKKSGEDIH